MSAPTVYWLQGFEQKVATPGYSPERPVLFVDLEEVSRGLKHPMRFDIQYARTDNFFNRVVYPSARAFLAQHVAQDLVRAHEALHSHGFGLLIFDGYRPWSVTRLFYKECTPVQRPFLADPVRGSSHNRGCAVDLTLYELATGREVEMPSGFDEMTERAYVDYRGGSAEARARRDLLQATMLAHGFTGIPPEWWHFNHVSHREWPVLDLSFDEITKAARG